MSGRRGYVNLEGYSASTVQVLASLLVAALIAVGVLATVLPITVRAPCTKGCGDLTIACDEYCVTDLIIGGGNTGLSLAKALSDNATRNVLVLEAGGNHVDDPLLSSPGNGLFFEDLYIQEPYRYHYHRLTTIQLGRRQIISNSGRVLGGSSTINDCLMFRGTPRFWDDIESRTGNTGRFASTAVYDIFKSIEWLNASNVYVPDATRHQSENPWKLQVRPFALNASDDTNLIAQLFGNALGYPYPNLVGFNDPAATVGVFPHGDWLYDFNATADPIIRWSSQKAFLNTSVVDPVTLVGTGTRQLRVLVNSPVQRILFHPNDATKAVGVEYLDVIGDKKRAYATSNVILSAFINTPMLLQRSGIGPTAVLQDAEIAPRVINEHVGQHWRVHPYMPLVFLMPSLSGVASPIEGPLISGLGSIITEDPVVNTIPGQRGFQYVTISFPYIMAAFVFQLNSPSEGTMNVYSDDPDQIARMDPNIFGNASSVVSWRTHIRQVAAAIQPGALLLSIDNATLWDDSLFEQWLYDNTNYVNPLAHSFGMTRLSDAPENGVLDPEFRVWGAKNLRVCDSNAFPEPTDGNPSYALAALGQICARAILGVPNAKKRAATPKWTNKKAKQSQQQLPPKVARTMSSQDYDSIVAFFNSAKTKMSAADAQRAIAAIQSTAMWRDLEAQYGPYTGKRK